MLHFADPAVLAGIPILLALWWYLLRRRYATRQSYIAFSALPLEGQRRRPLRERLARLPTAIRASVVVLLLLALARPQVPGQAQVQHIRGRNLMLALDISSSMRAVDFRPGNRLEVAKRVLTGFIRSRRDDLIGLVIFAGRAFTQIPPTTDPELVSRILTQVDIGQLPDGTAIGTAIALSLSHLEGLRASSSAILLITDGANNTGQPSPFAAAEAARALGIRIYAVGVSSRVTTAVPVDTTSGRPYADVPSRISGDEENILRRIAARTGGQYYRAANPAGLEQVIAQINQLETTDIPMREVRNYRELYALALLRSLGLLLIELALRTTWLRTIP